MEKKAAELPILKNAGTGPRGISRREAAQLLLSGAAGVALPSMGEAHPIHKHLANTATMQAAEAKTAAEKWAPEFCNAHQNESLVALAERIVPGSTRAQVNRFIDLLLSVESREAQQRFLNSLAAFDGESLRRFKQSFKALSEVQQKELLTAASTQESGRPRGQGARGFGRTSRPPDDQATLTLRDHFDSLKGWIAGAYYSSEVGLRELGWNGEVFHESFPGCQHPGGHS